MIRPAVAAAPARRPPLAVEVNSAKVPGPGSARNSKSCHAVTAEIGDAHEGAEKKR